MGVYKDEQGQTPVLSSIRKAQDVIHNEEITKAYQGPQGNLGFSDAMQSLIFGDESSALKEQRLKTLQTPGGCGALRLAAELIKLTNPNATIWVSNPTWANHIPLLGGAGLRIKEYPYYSAATQAVDFDAMFDALLNVPAGDLVLLHGCCHNPCGTDLSALQWQKIADLAVEQGFIPFVDLAYQGFGDGLADDAFGLRLLATKVPEMLVASSCSKNFGLYRERVGAITVMAQTPRAAQNAFSQLQGIARGIYSMPPSHGAALVERVLTDPTLRTQWQGDVTEMRQRIAQLRRDLNAALGMFSFLGLTPRQVDRLMQEYSVYMVNSSRINIAGINRNNIDYLATAIKAVL